jgi:potassium-transporting ATPase KdpC subunit
MRAQLMTGVRVLIVVTVFTGLIYPLVTTGLSLSAFGDEARGSLIERDGVIVGSALLGQWFSGPAYFQPRPSAAGAAASGTPVEVLDEEGQPTGETRPADPYDLTLIASGASNLGPNNPDLVAIVRERVAAFRRSNGLGTDTPVPIDAVTASGSGLDPHISVANARLQAPRVARERGLGLDEVLRLIASNTAGRVLGLFGEPAVNVLQLNLALDDLSDGGSSVP